MKTLIIIALISFLASLITGAISIPVLKRVKAGQPILKYVKTHEGKNGTPTMGGLFFILSAVAIYFVFGGGQIASVIVAIGLFYMLIGFLDDFLKIKQKHNEGLKPYQKIVFQTAIAILAAVYSFVKGLTVIYIPFYNLTVDIGFWIAPLCAFVFVAFTNSVNLTDGIDGLSGSVSVVYLAIIVAVITLESGFSDFIIEEEMNGIINLSVALLGALIGFLVYNVNKASVFMGDTGSLSLGAFLCGISVFSGNSLLVPIIGVTFVWSSLSVIIQVLRFKTSGKRMFLMAPYHHHLQMKGYTEAKIAFIYSLITVIIGAVVVITYL